MRSSSMARCAAMRLVSTSCSAAMIACCDSRSLLAFSWAILAACAARLTSISRCCSKRAYSLSLSMVNFSRSASRFLLAIDTLVSCSISLRWRRRFSIASVNFVKPSASKALSGLKNSRPVWSSPVKETDSSSNPFFNKSSETTCCTFCTKSIRFSCNSSMAISAATERSASTNLPSTSSFSASGLVVFKPKVCAALAIASEVG